MSEEPLLALEAKELAKSRGIHYVGFVGRGAFKETFRVSADDDTPLALKLTHTGKWNPSRSPREIEALLKCDTPLIAKLHDYGIFSMPDGTEYHFSLEEFLDGGTLTDRLTDGTLAVDIVREIAINLTHALEYLKTMGLVHRDIKPDNIMFRKGTSLPVLVDLGLVRDLSRTSVTPSWAMQGPGTPYYSAPEQLNNEKHLIDWRTDQFSLGVVLGICLTGTHPFADPDTTEANTVARIAERKHCSKVFCHNVSQLNFGGIERMLEPWPIHRFQSTEQLVIFLERSK